MTGLLAIALMVAAGVQQEQPKCHKGEYLSVDGRCLHNQTGETHPAGDGCNTSTCMDAACHFSSTTLAYCIQKDDPAIVQPSNPPVTLETARQKKDKLEPPKYEDWSVTSPIISSGSLAVFTPACAGGIQIQDGSCELTITFSADKKDLVCAEVPRRHDEPWAYKCTWKEPK